jgi:hypothetical protein
VWRPIAGLNITVFTYAAWRRDAVHGPLSRVLPLLPRPERSPDATDA